MKIRLPGMRLRLLDAVVIAAVGLLTLKGIDLLRGGSGADPSSPTVATLPASGPSVVPGGEELPEFARVLAHARSNYVPPQVVMTGSTERGEAPAAPLDAANDRLAPVERNESLTAQAILDRIGTRRDELERRIQDLQLREELLQKAERDLAERMRALEAREARAASDAGDAGAAPKAGLAGIVTMYETMRPKDAARVFDRLALPVLVPVVQRMNPRRMAEILAVMSPEAAERLTIALARQANIGSVADAGGAPAAAAGGELQAIPIPRRN